MAITLRSAIAMTAVTMITVILDCAAFLRKVKLRGVLFCFFCQQNEGLIDLLQARIGRNFQRGVPQLASRVAHFALRDAIPPEALAYLVQNLAM